MCYNFILNRYFKYLINDGEYNLIKTIKTASWDATLDTNICNASTHAVLTIYLRLGFKQINPEKGAATGTYHDYGDSTETARKTVKWTNAEWATWKKTFATSAQKFWHHNFLLINNFSLFKYTCNCTEYIPDIWCDFNISIGDASPMTKALYHHTIDVVKLDKSESFFGSHSKLYDNLDISPTPKGTDSKGNTIMQRAHVHEIGHLLGLGHVDEGKAHCPTNGNTNIGPCYGVADYDKYSVMGSGMQLRDKHANPWRRAIIGISKKGDMANAKDWAVSKTCHFPRKF